MSVVAAAAVGVKESKKIESDIDGKVEEAHCEVLLRDRLLAAAADDEN